MFINLSKIFVIFPKLLAAITLILSIYSCSGLSSIYSSDYALSAKQVKSKTTDLLINIPLNWKTFDANDKEFIDIWLLNPENNATIYFQPINFQLSRIQNENQELQKITALNKALNKSKETNSSISNEEQFKYGAYMFYAYEISTGQAHSKRIVIFKFKDVYYQSLAQLTNETDKSVDTRDLFSIQNSILTSIKTFSK
ncbi:MAG: hypothetical protein CVV23_12225 [Ignavibacteriae bacterium HGW-Ignavibacteriae-2]|jgi:hypothetical protein|nr:MAG: hypothetical protein CVV23_12225 [Ignavibacteriae bacterium HGW-Ignavibacteriae-2]